MRVKAASDNKPDKCWWRGYRKVDSNVNARAACFGVEWRRLKAFGTSFICPGTRDFASPAQASSRTLSILFLNFPLGRLNSCGSPRRRFPPHSPQRIQRFGQRELLAQVSIHEPAAADFAAGFHAA